MLCFAERSDAAADEATVCQAYSGRSGALIDSHLYAEGCSEVLTSFVLWLMYRRRCNICKTFHKMALRLTYRPAQPDDLELLRSYRVECTWGLDRLMDRWLDPDRPLCVLTVQQDGVAKDVGMGGWVLEDPADIDLAHRASQTVQLSKLTWTSMSADTQRLFTLARLFKGRV